MSREKPRETAKRQRELTIQVVVRLDPRLHGALKRDAERNGRTVAQSIRFLLGQQLAAEFLLRQEPQP